MEEVRELTTEELAEAIWKLDSEQQAKLIRELSEVAEEWAIMCQLDAVCEALNREKRLSKIKRLVAEFVSRI
jgi:hypothetical protein